MSAIDDARSLCARGWRVVPIPHAQKGPRLKGWQTLRLADADLPEHFNGQPMNIGVLLGEPSGGLIDVDLDCPEAVRLADAMLPPTGCIFGRASRPRSHRLYRIDGSIETERLRAADGSTIIEARFTGAQTVAPGSTHPSGEAVRWDADQEPATVDPETLLRSVRAIAAAVRAMRGEAEPSPHPEPQPHPQPAARQREPAEERVRERAAKYLAAMPPAVSGAGGHSATLTAASAMVNGFALPHEEAYGLLLEQYNPRCEPPWSEPDLRRKVSEAAKLGSSKGFGYLRDAAPPGRMSDDTPLTAWDAAHTGEGPEGREVAVAPEPPVLSLHQGDYRRDYGPAGPSGHQATGSGVLVRMADVEARTIPWLWENRIAAGRMTLLVGRPGLGKSFMTCDMAARVSNGWDWPDGAPCRQGSVLLVSAEDDPADTIRPRLDAAEADCSRVHVLRGVMARDDRGNQVERVFTLADLDALEGALESIGDCRLCIIDPIGSYLGGRANSDRDNEVRGILAPVAALAERFETAMLVVAHNRKAEAAYADDTAMGSRAFTGLARNVLHLMPDREDKRRRLLLSGKSNLGPPAPGLAFEIDGQPASLRWELGTLDMNADEGMRASGGSEEQAPARSMAEEWLSELLQQGPMRSDEVKAQAVAAGMAWRTVRRAQESLGITPRKAGFDGGWVWTLPGWTPPKVGGEREGGQGGHSAN